MSLAIHAVYARCSRWPAWTILGLALAALSAYGADAVPTPLGVPLPQSVFVNDLAMGKDPFFPVSQRRQPPVVAKVVQLVPADSNRAAYLVLKGVSGPQIKRIALINNMTFVAGEEGQVRTSAGMLKIRCVEVQEKTAIVIIDGESVRHELRLRESPAVNTKESSALNLSQGR